MPGVGATRNGDGGQTAATRALGRGRGYGRGAAPNRPTGLARHLPGVPENASRGAVGGVERGCDPGAGGRIQPDELGIGHVHGTAVIVVSSRGTLLFTPDSEAVRPHCYARAWPPGPARRAFPSPRRRSSGAST